MRKATAFILSLAGHLAAIMIMAGLTACSTPPDNSPVDYMNAPIELCKGVELQQGTGFCAKFSAEQIQEA
jgi:hypothetical protein